MIWSSTGISMILPISFIFLVICKSGSLGLGLPEGWLWQRIMALAKHSMAALKMILVSTTVPATPPLLINSDLTTRFDRLRYNTQNSSWGMSCKNVSTYW